MPNSQTGTGFIPRQDIATYNPFDVNIMESLSFYVKRGEPKENKLIKEMNKTVLDNVILFRESDEIEKECKKYKEEMESKVKKILSTKESVKPIFSFFSGIGIYTQFLIRSDIVPTFIELYFQLDDDIFDELVRTMKDLINYKDNENYNLARVFLIIKSYIEKSAYARNNELIRIVKHGGRVDRESFRQVDISEF